VQQYARIAEISTKVKGRVTVFVFRDYPVYGTCYQDDSLR